MEVKARFNLNSLEIRWQCASCGYKVTTMGMSDLLDGPPLCPSCADSGADEVMEYDQEALAVLDIQKYSGII